MPFDPDFPFVPSDPSQWWQARGLPHILVQPNAPANAGSTNPAGSDGIDDWFVPTPALEQDGFPDDWFVPGNAGGVASSPGDPSSPNNANVPAPAAAPNPAPPAPNPQPSAAAPGPSNQPAPPRPDPLAAYWALIPASRAGAMAWHPPIFLSPDPLSHDNIPASAWVTPPPFFLNSPGQPPSPAPASLDYSLPAYGLLGSIARMSAAPAPSDLGPPSAAHGMLGGFARMIAASAAPDPMSLSGSRGFLGSLANLPLPPSAQATPLAPYSGPFPPSDTGGFQASNLSYALLRNYLPARADPTGLIPDQPPTDQAFGAGDTAEGNRRPHYFLVAGDEEEEKEHGKLDPAVLSGLTDKGLAASPKALPTLPLALPFFPRPLPPRASAPRPPLRPSLLQPTSPPKPGPSASPANSAATLSDPKADLLQELFRRVGPGPYAPPNGGVPLSSPYGRGTIAERAQNNANGAKFGCHTCGTKYFGTPSGNPILDHQLSKALNPRPGAPAEGYPHCATCSSRQGVLVNQILQLLGFQ